MSASIVAEINQQIQLILSDITDIKADTQEKEDRIALISSETEERILFLNGEIEENNTKITDLEGRVEQLEGLKMSAAAIVPDSGTITITSPTSVV